MYGIRCSASGALNDRKCFSSKAIGAYIVCLIGPPTALLIWLAAAWKSVLDAMKPGVSWVDMQSLAYRSLLTKLKEGGLVV